MISISVNTETGDIELKSIFDKDLNINTDEEAAFETIRSYLPHDLLDHVYIERRSYNYISMFCGANDFLRLKFSAKAKWLSLRLPRNIAALNIDNPLFAAQTNKKQLHWKSNLSSLDSLNSLKDFIIASCVYIPEE